MITPQNLIKASKAIVINLTDREKPVVLSSVEQQRKIMTLLTDLTITLIGYLILAFSYLGFGWAGSGILRIDFPVKEKLFFLIWLGWAITLFLLQILN